MSDTELKATAEDVATLAANVRWCCSVMTKPDITQAQWRDFLNAVEVLARRASARPSVPASAVLERRMERRYTADGQPNDIDVYLVRASAITIDPKEG